MDAKSDNDVNDWVKQSVPGRAPFLDGSLGTTVKGGGYFNTAVGILETAASIIDANLLGTVLASQYGLSGRIKILSSEVECTAEVNLSDSRRLILKASRQSEAFDSFQFQSAVIKAVEGAKASSRLRSCRLQAPRRCSNTMGFRGICKREFTASL